MFHTEDYKSLNPSCCNDSDQLEIHPNKETIPVLPIFDIHGSNMHFSSSKDPPKPGIPPFQFPGPFGSECLFSPQFSPSLSVSTCPQTEDDDSIMDTNFFGLNSKPPSLYCPKEDTLLPTSYPKIAPPLCPEMNDQVQLPLPVPNDGCVSRASIPVPPGRKEGLVSNLKIKSFDVFPNQDCPDVQLKQFPSMCRCADDPPPSLGDSDSRYYPGWVCGSSLHPDHQSHCESTSSHWFHQTGPVMSSVSSQPPCSSSSSCSPSYDLLQIPLWPPQPPNIELIGDVELTETQLMQKIWKKQFQITHTDDHPHIPSEDGLSLPLTRQGIQHKEYVPIVSSVDLQMVEYVEVDRTLRQKIRHKLD
ncbi:hypothetical protein ADUPG1_011157, partial [Aduncisulcus paluster]